MTQQHIDNETLDLFVKTTNNSETAASSGMNVGKNDGMNSESYDEILDHLASCEECRQQVSVITTLHDDLFKLPYQSSLTADQQQMICDYIDGLLEASDAEKTRQLIKEHPDAKRAALHYQSHSESMATELPRGLSIEWGGRQSTDTVKRPQNSFFSDLISFSRQFFAVRSPMVYTMSATAAVLAAVLLLMQSQEMQTKKNMIASFQDNPTIQFTAKNKLPGVGFFAQSVSTLKPFENISVELVTENTVKLSWPEVDDVELYNLRIQVFNQGKKTVLRESSTQSNHTTFSLEPESRKNGVTKHYEWVLYGNTVDDRMFYASGGFVISKVQADNKKENNRDYDSW